MKDGKNTKAHTVYIGKDGERLPSVTTVLSVLNKPALVPWAWKLGLEGIDYKKFKDDKAEIGTLVHQMIIAHLKNEPIDYTLFTPKQREIAEVCLEKYWRWEKSHEMEVQSAEEPLIDLSERYGGTYDNYCILDGVFTLVDYKTSKSIYDEMIYQVAAYANLLRKAMRPVERAIILRIGRGDDEGFEERTLSEGELETGWKIFQHALAIYHLQKR